MKERPILFQAAMVRALLNDTKTQTRRVVKPQPDWIPEVTHASHTAGFMFPVGSLGQQCGVPLTKLPFGAPGDRLWVKETFAKNEVQPLSDRPPGDYIYRAELSPIDGRTRYCATWKPSIFCTRLVSRITLEVVSVRVERLNDITEADAVAEGVVAEKTIGCYDIVTDKGNVSVVEGFVGGIPKAGEDWQGYKVKHVEYRPAVECGTALDAYRALWCRINGFDSWELNPWVWVISFRRIKT